MGQLSPRPHDLLRLTSVGALQVDDPFQTERAHAVAAVDGQVWVVARRAASGSGRIPVGIRGATRAQRYGATVSTDAVRHVVSPWEIDTDPSTDRRQLPAFRALQRLRHHDAVRSLANRWGPGGSVGFELITGASAVTTSSDLDVVVDAPTPLRRDTMLTFADAAAHCPTRVDIQISTPLGGFALVEWLREDIGQVALRTTRGPILTTAPWG